MVFSPDGKTIAFAGTDGMVKLWNLDLNDLLNNICIWIGDYLSNNTYVSKKDKSLCDDLPVQKLHQQVLEISNGT